MKFEMCSARTIYVDCIGRTICYYDPYEVNEVITKIKGYIAQLEDDNALLRKNNAELRDSMRWRKSSEELPTDETEVPVILDNGWQTSDYFENKCRWRFYGETVKYWFLPPKAPSVE